MLDLPIGVEDYLAACESYYIDKTLLIKEIIDYGINKSFLITRPRRFGKSLNLSMIEYYFTNHGDFKYAFENKLIYKQGDKYLSYINKYPVIRFNLKGIFANSFNDLAMTLIKNISMLYRKFSELATSDKLIDFEKNEYNKIVTMSDRNPEYYVDALKELSYLLYKHYNQKVIILIDEYDAPIEQAYENNYYQEAINFFKRFYSNALKGNEYVCFSVITGVLEVSKESLYSGLNNPIVFHVGNENLTQYFGFTTDEVKKILSDNNSNLDIVELKKQYGGYGNDKTELFNPWSVMNAVNEGILSNYWVNTGTTSILTSIFEKIGFDNDELFVEYLNNNEKMFNFNNAINFNDLNSIDSLFSYLIQTGYLVAKRNNLNSFNVFIPNEEVKSIFTNEIINRNINPSKFNLGASFKNAIVESNEDKIKTLLEDYILESFSYLDLRQEKDYQILITGILSVLFDDYVVKSEVISRNGRCDIMICPKKNNDLGIVIELKKYKGRLSLKNLDKYSIKGLEQIKNNRYYSELIRRNSKKIIIFCFTFDEINVNVKCETIKK